MASSLEQTFEHAFIDGVTGMVSYPLNTTQRFEGTLGFDHISYSTQVEQTVFSGDYVLSEQTRDVVSPPSLNLAQASVAFVGDYSFFGFTSPVTGGRYRFEIDGTTGSENYATLVLDYRHYFYERPVTVALRALHYGRYGPDAESPDISPIFLGYESLVRGYSAASFTADECSGMTGENGCPQFNRLIGSRIAVANLEVRVPLLGTSDFGLINFPYLPTELSAFLDGGVAWSAGDSPVLHLATRSDERIPVFSAGVSTRVNLFGYLVVELFYAYPFQRPDAGWQFGFQVAPGW
jgi:hypothetical protein